MQPMYALRRDFMGVDDDRFLLGDHSARNALKWRLFIFSFQFRVTETIITKSFWLRATFSFFTIHMDTGSCFEIQYVTFALVKIHLIYLTPVEEAH